MKFFKVMTNKSFRYRAITVLHAVITVIDSIVTILTLGYVYTKLPFSLLVRTKLRWSTDKARPPEHEENS